MIGITGVARSGKDTLYSLIEKKLKELNIQTKRYALADNLKYDLRDFIIQKFNIDIYTANFEEKELIRPIMVAYGKSKRMQTQGRYWIELLNSKINEKDFLPVITDIRYQEYDKDEYFWLKKEKQGIMIHVSRVKNGKIILPANEEEAKNDKVLSELADYKIIWCTENNMDMLYNLYEKNIEEIYETYRRYRFNK
jgi:hypothetical protein